MKDFIVNEFGKVISKACERFGKENNLDRMNMQIVFRMNEENELDYVVLKEYKEWKEVEFNEILGVKIDFKGYGIFVPKFIKDLLISFSESLDKQVQSLSIMSLVNNNGEVINCLYNKNTFVQQIDLQEILQ